MSQLFQMNLIRNIFAQYAWAHHYHEWLLGVAFFLKEEKHIRELSWWWERSLQQSNNHGSMAMVAVMMVTIADKNIIIIVIIIIMTMMIVMVLVKHVVVKCSKGVFAIISKHVYTW